jgi:hypothetical protein
MKEIMGDEYAENDPWLTVGYIDTEISKMFYNILQSVRDRECIAEISLPISLIK